METPLLIGRSGVHLPHLRSSAAIGHRRCRLSQSLPSSPLWDAGGDQPRSVAVPALSAAGPRVCELRDSSGVEPQGISSAPSGTRLSQAFVTFPQAKPRPRGRGVGFTKWGATPKHYVIGVTLPLAVLAVSELRYGPGG